MTVREHFIAHCLDVEVVKLFRFTLPPHSLIRTCSSVQNSIFRRLVERMSRNFMSYFRGWRFHKV
jgi:hypothetical protein